MRQNHRIQTNALIPKLSSDYNSRWRHKESKFDGIPFKPSLRTGSRLGLRRDSRV